MGELKQDGFVQQVRKMRGAFQTGLLESAMSVRAETGHGELLIGESWKEK